MKTIRLILAFLMIFLAITSLMMLEAENWDQGQIIFLAFTLITSIVLAYLLITAKN